MSELWAARDKDGKLWIFDKKPNLEPDNNYYSLWATHISELPQFTLPNLRNMDGPIRVKVVPVEEDDTRQDLYEALKKAVEDYGKPGGPWNVLDEPGTWIQMAKDALKKARVGNEPDLS